MGTQVLAGTVGFYKEYKTKTFVVSQDTCLEAKRLPVKFKDASEGCWIDMRDATLDSRSIKTKN